MLTPRDMALLAQSVKTATRSPPRHTSNHMSNIQCEKLVELCREYYDIISDTGNSIESRTQRRRIWEFIATTLNEKGKTSFTAAQYKKKYQNLKTSLKAKMNALKRAQSGQSTSAEAAERKPSSVTSPVLFQQSPLSLVAATAAALPTPSAGLPFTSFFHSPISTTLPGPTTLVLPPVSLAGLSTPTAAQQQHHQQQQIFAPIPQIGLGLSLQTLMSSMVAQEGSSGVSMPSVSSPLSLSDTLLSPQPQPDKGTSSPKSESGASSGGAEETLSLADADPVDVFCMSLAEPVSRIRAMNSLLYTKLKREISVLVFETEIALLGTEDVSME
ncbi:hypothetical protein PFISCL1PPCAC_124 [Pristionchus fissidentatus]|uniref:Regulatory protein zeste n=1 Tax=Pristionchus fissidentatus TaxID=1538716 RepID=A0AAV5UP46_9BILA|nr:hypothetical protein PFISCL1PPCAC_124 [Pristionchus fissidentatus]